MMMPANYSAVNAEIVYGGAGIGDYLPDVWSSKNVKTLSTNVLTILSNSFTNLLVKQTLGTMFGGNWGGDDGVKLFGSDGSVTALFKYKRDDTGINADLGEMNTFNKFMTALGTAAAVYTLGTTNAKSFIGSAKVVDVNGNYIKF